MASFVTENLYEYKKEDRKCDPLSLYQIFLCSAKLCKNYLFHFSRVSLAL